MIEVVTSLQLGDFFSVLVDAVAKKSYLKKPVRDYVIGVLINQVRLDEVFTKGDHQILFRPLGIEHLVALRSKNKVDALQDVGDTCLILLGLFKGFVLSKGLSTTYYCNLGSGSYKMLSEITQEPIASIFRDLSYDFVNLVELLYTASNVISLKRAEINT